jgi:predicted aspartyl protease
MKKTMKPLYPALTALALLLPALSQAAGDAGSCKYVPVAKLTIEAPEHRLPTVPGSINGKPATMLVDTGASESMMVRAGAERLGLPLDPTGDYRSGVGATWLYVTQVNDLSVGDSHTGRITVPVLGDFSFKPDFDAIVGADFLLQADMEVSMASHYLQFFRASGCGDTFLAYWDRNAMEIPFIGATGYSHGRKPLVAVELNGVKLTAILDTGAMSTTVKRRAAERAGVRVDAPGVRKGDGISGVGDDVLDSWVVDFKSFRIGDETVNNPQMLVSEESHAVDGGPDIILGDDFLRAHRVLFAMSQDRLYMSYLGGELFGAKQQAPEQAPKAR